MNAIFLIFIVWSISALWFYSLTKIWARLFPEQGRDTLGDMIAFWLIVLTPGFNTLCAFLLTICFFRDTRVLQLTPKEISYLWESN